MKFEFPDTGEGVTEGQFLEWNVEKGDKIEEDEVVGEAETDKAVVEIPAPSDGVVKELRVSPGDTVQVGEVIMELDADQDHKTKESSKDEKGAKKEKTQDYNNKSSSSSVLALPKVRKLAQEKNIDLESLKTGERITEEDVLKASESSESNQNEDTKEESQRSKNKNFSSNQNEGVNATPAVRKLAREKNIDISQINGSGKGGKVTREDIESRQVSKSTSKQESSEIKELSNLERTIAEKMAQSKSSAPHVTHIETADVTRLVEIREDADSDVEPHLTYMPFIMKACMLAAKEYPRANAHFNEEKMEIEEKSSYNFNIAVDTERGLLVPRIDNIEEKNLLQLAKDLGGTIEKAQKGDISKEEMEPGSFSITNIGVIGGEAFTPIINPPQTCILGVGRIQETPQVVNGEIAPRTTVKLSFSYDHRVLDGATAAKFVNKVVESLENPEEMMVEI